MVGLIIHLTRWKILQYIPLKCQLIESGKGTFSYDITVHNRDIINLAATIYPKCGIIAYLSLTNSNRNTLNQMKQLIAMKRNKSKQIITNI